MQAAIIRAIQNKAVLEFRYASSTTGIMEHRVVEPHLLGVKSGTGNVMLVAWQTNVPPGERTWHNFAPSKIVGLRDTGATFQDARPHYNPNDKTMSRILARI